MPICLKIFQKLRRFLTGAEHNPLAIAASIRFDRRMISTPHSILAFDCSTGPTSIAVLVDSEEAAILRDERREKQSALLLPMIESCLKRAGLRYAQLDAIVTTRGPGSFTGIRIGLAAARGLALASGVPLFGFTGLEAVMYAAAPHAAAGITHIAAALRAGRGECYVQLCETDSGRITSTGEATALEIASLGAALPSAPASVMIAGNLHAGEWPPGCHVLEQIPGALTLAHMLCDAACTPWVQHRPGPYYIRPPDAKLPSPASV